MNYRNSISLNAFYHRCTATCTGASGRGEDNRVNMVINQFLSDLLRVLACACYCCSITNCGIEVFVKASDLAFLDELLNDIYRKNAVSILVSVYWIVSAVSCLLCLFCQIHNTLDVVLSVLGSTGGLNMIWVALRNDTAGGY